MKVDPFRLEVMMARRKLNYKLLAERGNVVPSTLRKMRRGEDVRASVVGKVAEALGVDPEEILMKEETRG